MKSKISERPLFSEDIPEDDVENVGIMQGFMDGEYDEDEDDEDYQTEKMLDRRPNSPEILMNNLRGDMRSIDARVEELADLVGYNAASETPEGVLALLQPILAAQQAPAMPPQGMMPPPPMPPQGMMPPEMMGGMPPEAAMSGIGALPMDQGPVPEMPVMMATGGYVQRFSDGTDEDGVAPIKDTSSYAGVFSPDVIQAARDQVLRSLNQAPMAVPDLASEVEKRTPLYEKLLGVDPRQSQAQLLFELGQRAFNYGANVDDQGRPLYGSQAARLAGAVRTLPGAMGQITSQLEQQKRGVRTAALQASEKDVQNIRERNAKLVETQTKLWQEIAKSAGKGMSFGTGTEGTAWSTLTRFAPDYAAGTLPEDKVRMFESSLAIVSKPTQYTDPFSGNIVLREPIIPDFVTSAVTARKNLSKITPTVKTPDLGASIPSEEVVPPGSAVVVAQPGSVDRAKQEDIARRFKAAKTQFETGKMPKAEYDTLVATLNEESKQVKATVGASKPKKGEIPGRTIWGSTELIAGPVPKLATMASRVPGLGDVAPQMQQARSFVTSAVNDLVSNLRTNDRFSEQERQEIKSEIDISPKFWDDPKALQNRIIGVDEFLRKKLTDTQAQIADTTLPVKIRQDATDRATDIQKFLTTLGVPVRVYSLEDVQLLRPGTPFLWNGTEPRTRQ